MVTAIFPAAGKGKRMHSETNKVFMKLGGVPILVRTLQKFSQCREIDQLIVVVAAAEVKLVEETLQHVPKLKPWKVVTGGAERQDSVWLGIQAMENPAADDIVLVHDAARPLIETDVIEATIAMVREKGAAIAAVPAKNTIKFCSPEGEVISTPDRKCMQEVQTPQGFRYDILAEANKKAIEDNFLGTDDASLVERTGVTVYIVPSSYRNIKITTPEDMVIASALLMNEGAELLGNTFKDIGDKIKEIFNGREDV